MTADQMRKEILDHLIELPLDELEEMVHVMKLMASGCKNIPEDLIRNEFVKCYLTKRAAVSEKMPTIATSEVTI